MRWGNYCISHPALESCRLVQGSAVRCSKSRSLAEPPNIKVSGYGMPRYQGKRLNRALLRWLDFQQPGWYRGYNIRPWNSHTLFQGLFYVCGLMCILQILLKKHISSLFNRFIFARHKALLQLTRLKINRNLPILRWDERICIIHINPSLHLYYPNK